MPMQATTTSPLFAAELTPHRSLTKRGVRIVIGLVVVLTALPGLLFFSLGAWPVIGFMGLDVIAIAVALHVSHNRGQLREQISLWSDRLEIVTTDAKGNASKQKFNPKAVRLLIDRDFEERTTRLRLRSGTTDTELGAFLSPDDKSSFAKAFGSALRQARR